MICADRLWSSSSRNSEKRTASTCWLLAADILLRERVLAKLRLRALAPENVSGSLDWLRGFFGR